MAETIVIAPGTPSWVDLASPDLEAAIRFYTALFGWTAHRSPAPEAGGYTLFHAGEKQVAGASPAMVPGQPAAWTTYISVADADATAARAAEAGAKVVMAPTQVMDLGKMAVLQDPTGAAFALWQPGAHKGAELYNAAGALCWNELATRDVPAAERFYTRLFGWGAKTSGEGANRYTEWQLEGRTVGGMMPMPAMVPADVPAHWLAYFGVPDCVGTARRAEELGGSVMMQPTPIPQGTMSVMADPQGAAFAVIQLG